MERRDYVERLIEQCAAFIRDAVRLAQQGKLDPALLVIRQAEEVVGGPLRGVLDQLDPRSAVDVAGPLEHERVRLYAELLEQEAALQDRLGDANSAARLLARADGLRRALAG